MVRLTRAQQQERTQAAVLAAARDEFAEHGYVEAKVDRIAERAELTRGAVYSNFPGKRALYLAVLVDMVEGSAAGEVPRSSPPSAAAALGAFARVWLERLPLAGDTPAAGQLQLRSLAGVVDDEPARTALAQVTGLEALLLALALESGAPRGTGPARRVRLAELVLTLLHGAGHLAETAPGVGDPFDVARACEHLAGLDLADTWDPPHLPYVAPAQPCRRPVGPAGGAARSAHRSPGRPRRGRRDRVPGDQPAGRGRGGRPWRPPGRPGHRGRPDGRPSRDRAARAAQDQRPHRVPPARVRPRPMAAPAPGPRRPRPDRPGRRPAGRRRRDRGRGPHPDGRIVARANGRGAAHAAATAGDVEPPRSRGPGA